MSESEIPLAPGRVVCARAGRDKGKLFIVVGFEAETGYALLADGRGRRMEKPKRKKAKHLQPTKVSFTNIGERLKEGARVLDAELRKSLAELAAESGFAPKEEG
ncbi:MAG: KOW domain-containing RNA-binding protein [Christensenellaceae bacterium]|jgi:ribosomal protein L14E/L6E/L27E|nr:KOW domain-containing RNA-binding protein [Christensenellaceae bacterium]